MNVHPLQLGASLHKSEYRPQGTFLEQQWDRLDAETAQDAYFDAAMNSAQFPGAFHESISHQNGVTNAFNQFHAPNTGFDVERSISHDHQASGFATQSHSGLIRSFENGTEVSSPRGQERESTREDIHCSPYNPHGRPVSMPSASASHALSSPYLSANSAPQSKPSTTMYSPFRGYFTDSQEAKSYRHENTRFGRVPYLAPEIDASITAIEFSRHIHVERIYNAMTRGDVARDNPSSIAMKRWVHAAHYAPDLVEAYAHKVFDCLLLQAKFGYRGWHHNDYVADERKGEDDDRDVDCAGRLDNIIAALEQEKTICEDVMNSACQIRMFVNAPRAYSNRKYQNRIGNSKRGKAKEGGEGNLRPLKTRKTRARSGTGVSDLSGSRHTTPQPQLPLPYFSTSGVQCLASSPLADTSHHLAAATQTPAQQQPQPHTAFPPNMPSHKITTPPPLLPTTPFHIPRTTTIPPLHSPFLSPPPLSLTHLSAPTTPNNAPPLPLPSLFSPWPLDPFLSPPETTCPSFPHTKSHTSTSLSPTTAPAPVPTSTPNPNPSSFSTHDWPSNWAKPPTPPPLPLPLLPPPPPPSSTSPSPSPSSSSHHHHHHHHHHSNPTNTPPHLFSSYDATAGVSLADVENSLYADSRDVATGDFHAFWSGLKGVQRFPG